jgi:hypothetical protein
VWSGITRLANIPRRGSGFYMNLSMEVGAWPLILNMELIQTLCFNFTMHNVFMPLYVPLIFSITKINKHVNHLFFLLLCKYYNDDESVDGTFFGVLGEC